METYDETSSKQNEITVREYEKKADDWANLTPGAYEAKYNGLKVYDPVKKNFGLVKDCRLFFIITKGKFVEKKVSFKGNYMQDKESRQWFIGAKSELAKAIRVISGGGKSLDDSHIGKRVILVVGPALKKDGSSYIKKDGTVFYTITAITPTTDDGETQAPAPAAAKPPASAPVAASAPATPPVQKAAIATAAPSAEPKKTEEPSVLDELGSLSDFSE